MAFLYLAVGTSGGALAFLAAQRISGRTPPEVAGCYEHAKLLESLQRDLDALAEGAAKAEGADTAREDLEGARKELREAIGGLQRGADLVV